MKFTNPIIPGNYPDPSICRVGEDYYLVNSSFEYFPGLPVFHSRDLVRWRQLGHAIDRVTQLDLDCIPVWNGLWAPTIRFHDGTFYIINTLTEWVPSKPSRRRGNFIVTASDPAGPWSDPVWIPGAPGIDPSLLFDDDGRVWYTGNRPTGRHYEGHCEIWTQELDLKTMRLAGRRHAIWDGALKRARYAEGPHIHKNNGWYYLFAAEGGTGIDHAVSVARSRSVTGPYEGHSKNPIVTNRACGGKHPIGCTGHPDIVDTPAGDWWMVLLAVRPYGNSLCNLGRETFLVPMTWENEWPVVSPGSGQVSFEYPAPALPKHAWPAIPARDDFDKPALADCWNFIRTPRGDFWSLAERPGFLRLRPKRETICEPANPAFIGRRQQHIDFTASAAMEFRPASGDERAGLAMQQNPECNCRFVVSGKTNPVVRLFARRGKDESCLARKTLPKAGSFLLEITANGPLFDFRAGTGRDRLFPVAEGVKADEFCMDISGAIAGAYIGMYAECPNPDNAGWADFDWFEYKGR